MFWATRLGRVGLVMLASLTLALAACDSSSDDDSGGGGGGGPTDSETGSTAAASVQNALGAALSEASADEGGLTAAGPIPAEVMGALMAAPGVGPIGRIGSGNGEQVGPVTVTLNFEGGPYPCYSSGTVGVSGGLSYTYSYELDTLPYFFEEDFGTTDPLELTLDACSDGAWTLDGDVTYEVDEYLFVGTDDELTYEFTYEFADNFDADITGSDDATGEEGALEMSFDLTGMIEGTYDSSGNYTYDVYEWTFDLTINGESYSCSVSGVDEEADCE